MQKILIPIDFSENAEHALDAARIMADKESTELLILHAYQPYIADVSDVSVTPGNALTGLGTTDFLTMTTELEGDFRSKLDQYADKLKAEGYNCSAIWATGGIQECVGDAIDEYNPDLVVVGRTGTGGFLDKLIGSSATNIALHSKCPVMVIPPQSTPRKFQEVVYATQFEYTETQILKEVYVLMNHLGSRLTLLKINTDEQPDIQPDNQFIDEIKANFNITERDIVIRKSDHVLDGIEAFCDEINADLLIVSSRERSFIEEFLINPGVTKKLIVDTHVPLLVFHLR